MSAHSTTLPRSPASIRVARGLVETHAAMLGSRRRKDAVLMVSESVTNALVHGTGRISLRIDVASDALRVEVSDQGTVTLAPSPTPGAYGGGLESWISSPMSTTRTIMTRDRRQSSTSAPRRGLRTQDGRGR